MLDHTTLIISLRRLSAAVTAGDGLIEAGEVLWEALQPRGRNLARLDLPETMPLQLRSHLRELHLWLQGFGLYRVKSDAGHRDEVLLHIEETLTLLSPPPDPGRPPAYPNAVPHALALREANPRRTWRSIYAECRELFTNELRARTKVEQAAELENFARAVRRERGRRNGH